MGESEYWRAGSVTLSLEAWIRNANEADILQYFDRYRAEGESAAMKWLREQTKAP
jgi:hypothetical protein